MNVLFPHHIFYSPPPSLRNDPFPAGWSPTRVPARAGCVGSAANARSPDRPPNGIPHPDENRQYWFSCLRQGEGEHQDSARASQKRRPCSSTVKLISMGRQQTSQSSTYRWSPAVKSRSMDIVSPQWGQGKYCSTSSMKRSSSKGKGSLAAEENSATCYLFLLSHAGSFLNVFTDSFW